MVNLTTFNELLSPYIDTKIIVDCFNKIVLNDKAHNIEHVYFVCRRGLKIGKQLNLCDNDLKLIAYSTLFHDIGCHINRKMHHNISADMAEQMLERILSNNEITIISNAIRKHRASYNGTYENIIEEITAIADRGSFDYKLNIQRCFEYLIAKKENQSKDFHYFLYEITDHLKDKFGENGYCWSTYPKLGFEIYKDEINLLKLIIKDMKIIQYTLNPMWFDFKLKLRE